MKACRYSEKSVFPVSSRIKKFFFWLIDWFFEILIDCISNENNGRWYIVFFVYCVLDFCCIMDLWVECWTFLVYNWIADVGLQMLDCLLVWLVRWSRGLSPVEDNKGRGLGSHLLHIFLSVGRPKKWKIGRTGREDKKIRDKSFFSTSSCHFFRTTDWKQEYYW